MQTVTERRLEWAAAHINYDGDECLFGPFQRNHDGYPFFSVRQGKGFRTVYAHRLMCEYRNGPPPSKKHHAAHSCNNGHLGCCNPKHLDWKTPGENQRDRYQSQGGPMPRQRLSHQQVDEIRALKGKEPKLETAARYGVTPRTIWSIQIGLLHNHDNKRRILTDEEVRTIRSKYLQLPAQKLGEQYGVSKCVIWKVWQRRTYAYVADGDSGASLRVSSNDGVGK